jgi:hypothetical protein
LVETNSEHAGAKKAPRREGRRGAEQRAWAGGQIKRAEQSKHGRSDLVPLQSNFFSKNFAAGEFAQQPTRYHWIIGNISGARGHFHNA